MSDRQTAQAKQGGMRMEPESGISVAWRDLAALGLPYRYGGRTPEGLYEFVIVDPGSGAMVTSGKGATLAQAMAAAAGAGRRLTQEI